METICIVPMTAADLTEVMAIEEISFSVPWSEEDFREMLAHPHTVFFTARTPEGAICGYIGFIGVMETGDILNVAVHPDHRRQHIGQQLMSAAEADAVRRGVETMLLEVRESNRAARRLYAVMGYEEIAVRKNYYRKPIEHAIIMRKALGGRMNERRTGDGKDIT